MMRTAEAKTSATAARQTVPFFGRGEEGTFFGKSSESDPFFSQASAPVVQTKLTVGRPDDLYEKEANAMADQVVQRLATPDVHTKNETTVQAKPLVGTITPLVQTKCAACEEEEKLQKKEEDEDQLQKKPIFESSGDLPDDDLQRKCAACEEKGKLQKKGDTEAAQIASPPIESRLASTKGSGSPLPDTTRQPMESFFGADFSGVRIHNDHSAVHMSKDLQAQAFTHGDDIYFNRGKYNVNSRGGQHLLAHELTHTIQQQGVSENRVQRNPRSTSLVHTDSSANSPFSFYPTPLSNHLEGLDSTKYSERSEQLFRRAGQHEAADAIRACRTYGPASCEKILTSDEAYQMYMRSENAVRYVPKSTDPRKEVIRYAGAAVKDLVKYGEYQKRLRAFGYVILDDPLAVCIGQCHYPNQPTPPFRYSSIFEYDDFSYFQAQPLTSEELQKLTDWVSSLDSPSLVAEEANFGCALLPYPGLEDQPPARNITRVARQFYGHGAYMGAAPQMLTSERWSCILQVLMPDVYYDIALSIRNGDYSSVVIPMLENNPVMAAFGMMRSRSTGSQGRGEQGDAISQMEAIEWDAFLPTEAVNRFNEAESDEERQDATGAIVDDMLIAHGNQRQTRNENLPIVGSRQYANVRRTPKSALGGTVPGAWMDIFGRALEIGSATDWARLYEQYHTNPEDRYDDPEDQALFNTFMNRRPVNQVIEAYRQLAGKDRFSILLDVKSRDATPQLLNFMLRELNSRGIHVYGIGSFTLSEISGLDDNYQIIDSQVHLGVVPIKFFHYAYEFQTACREGKIHREDRAMFNGGSLLVTNGQDSDGQPRVQIPDGVIDSMEEYKSVYEFHLGIYVQEEDTGFYAAETLSQITGNHPDLFDMGFAWGGLSDAVAADVDERKLGLGVQDHPFLRRRSGSTYRGRIGWDPRRAPRNR